jgi:CP family cyanate transporter-like MFS transporter
VVLGWLPSILTDAGWDPRSASLPLAVFSAMSIPMSIVLPAVAGRRLDQRGLVALTTACYALGYLGLLAAQAVPGALSVLGWLSAGLLGAGNGAFPLAVTLIGLRSRRAEVTTALSALVQSGGYLLAVAGPLLVGLLHQVCGGWRIPLLLVLATLAPQLLSGWRSARPGTVEGGPEPDRPATAQPAAGRHRSSRLGRPAAPPAAPAARPVRAAQPAWSPSASRRSSGPIR